MAILMTSAVELELLKQSSRISLDVKTIRLTSVLKYFLRIRLTLVCLPLSMHNNLL
jgi:hypothetical protein